MEAAQEVAERRVVRDEDQRLGGLRRRTNEGNAPRLASRHLHDESDHGGGSENVPPLGILRRDMLHRLEQDADSHPVVEPKPRRLEEPLHNVVVMGTTTELIFTSLFSMRTP